MKYELTPIIRKPKGVQNALPLVYYALNVINTFQRADVMTI